MGEAVGVDVVAESVRVAKFLGRMWGRDPGEFLGAVWQGVDRAVRNGVTKKSHLTNAGYRSSVDYIRDDGRGGWGYERRRDVVRREAKIFALPAGEDGDTEYGWLEPAVSEEPGEEGIPEATARRVREAVASLPFREREAVEMVFGIGGVRPLSQAEAAAVLDCCPSRVCQYLKSALSTLQPYVRDYRCLLGR